MHLVSPRCAALSQSLSPLGRRALAAFIDGRLPAGQLQDELLRASNLESPSPGASAGPSAGTDRQANLPLA